MFNEIPVHDERARALASAVHDLDRAYRETRRELLEDLGVSDAELLALTAVGREHGMTASHLARTIGLTTSATTSLLDRLEADGLLVRQRNPADRRSVVAVLTRRGDDVMTGAYRSYVGRFETLLAARPGAGECVDDLVVKLQMLTEALTGAKVLHTLTA